MAKKNKDQDQEDTHELILFREPTAREVKKFESASLEYSNQEDKINLVCKSEPFGGNYLYSLVISNKSVDPITEIKIRVRIPVFLKLCRSTPPTITLETINFEEDEEEETQVKIEFEVLKGKAQKQINLYFCPISLEEKGEIRSSVTFVNDVDFVRAIETDAIVIQFDPFSIERKILPSAEVKKFLQKPEIKKAIKSIGIGKEEFFDENYYFNQMTKIIQDQNFQLIIKDKDNKIVWFYGTDLVSGKDILVIGQIISGKIEWLAASQNHPLLISILTNFVNTFIDKMMILNQINSEDQIFHLECKYCGNILSSFPGKGKTIECKKCNYEQVIWN
jgi:hypothetical protein